MSRSYFNNISKYFEGKRFNEIFIQNNSDKFAHLLKYSELRFDRKPTIQEFYSELYSHISSSYRNDVIYKIELIDKFIDLYSVQQKCFLLNEFKVNRRLADLAIFNGSNIVFEIKSDVDKANNIEEQFKNYQNYFDYSYLVTSKERCYELEKRIPETAGVYILDEQFNLIKLKGATYNENQSIEKMFRMLRKDEYLSMVQEFYGRIPDMPNTKIREFSFNLLKELGFRIFKKNFIRLIKKRKGSYILEDLSKVKKELRQGYLSNNLHPNKCTIHS